MTGERVVLPDADRARLSVVVLTYNRADRVLDALARLAALPDRIEIVAVDNASTDGTAERIAANFPLVKLVRAPRNLGAAGRNLGVARVQTEYVAFCDDDTWWSPGSLSRAVDVLDAAPRVGVLNARVIVGEHGAIDETCERMRDSPLARDGLPGPALIGFMAGACVFRADVFRQTGGYEPRLFIGGEETLVSLDVLRAGHGIVYMDELVLHHHPSPLRDSPQRRRLLARNAAWVAWMRLPLAEALCATRAAIAVLPALPDLKELIVGIAWALRRRRVIDKRVQLMRRLVHEDDARREAHISGERAVGSTRAT